MGEMRNAFNILVRKPEGKGPLRRPRCRWKYNIKMYLREVGYNSVHWIHLAQNRDKYQTLVNTVMNILVLLKTGNLTDRVTLPLKKYSAP
jgi:hypothetical protein